MALLILTTPSLAAPVYEGLYVLDGTGMVHSVDTVTIDLVGMPFGWDIGEDIELVGNETGQVTGAYLLSGYGDAFPLPENNPAVPVYSQPGPYFGWDIARDLEPAVDWTVRKNGQSGYYILDGFGGIFAIGDASPPPYFKIYKNASSLTLGQDVYIYWGWDVAVDLEVSVTQTSTPRVNGYYVLDQYGGVHWNIEDDAGTVQKAPWAQGIYPEPQPYFGWNIARDMEVTRSAKGYYLLDGYGGIHGVGDAIDDLATVLNGGVPLPRFEGMDIFEDIETVWNETPAIEGLVMLDAYGGLYEVGNVGIVGSLPPFEESGHPWDIARDMEISPYYTFVTDALVSGP